MTKEQQVRLTRLVCEETAVANYKRSQEKICKRFIAEMELAALNYEKAMRRKDNKGKSNDKRS